MNGGCGKQLMDGVLCSKDGGRRWRWGLSGACGSRLGSYHPSSGDSSTHYPDFDLRTLPPSVYRDLPPRLPSFAMRTMPYSRRTTGATTWFRRWTAAWACCGPAWCAPSPWAASGQRT